MLRPFLLHRLILVAIGVALVWSPMPAHAAEPPLGEAVVLPDGTVLPPLPADQFAPTAQAEMLAEHGGEIVSTDEPDVGGVQGMQSTAAEDDPTGGAVAADELHVTQDGAIGPAGPLPNGLRREVFGFLPYWKLDTTTRAALRLDLLSTIAYFSIGVESDGSLKRGTSSVPTIGWAGWTSSAMTEIINSAHARGVRVVPTVTMMAWDGNYTAMSTLLNSASNRGRLVGEIVQIVRDRRADGVNVDFEPVPSSLRSQFTMLVREIKGGLVAAGVGSFVTVDTMAGAAAWATGYDVAGLTASGAADALMVMAYDFSYGGTARAGGVAPIDSDYLYASADAMRDHLARVPAGKLIWGTPHYGRAWNTTSDQLNATVRSPAQSVAFSYYFTDSDGAQGGKVLATRHGRRWDAAGQVPWFAFWDAASNGWRQGYYDDPVSLAIKYDAVARNGLAGIGIWALGMDTGVSDLWNGIEDRFVRRQMRLSGGDRYATAAAVSTASFAPGVPVAYVATGASFPDALAAGPIAAHAGGPVLLTQRGGVPSATAAELTRLRPERIVVMGGTAAVSDAAFDALRQYAVGGNVTRISGADRYATAAAASAATFAPGVEVAYIATGANFPDALAGGVAAGRQRGPVLLVRQGSIPQATAAELARLRPGRVVVLGGTGVVSDGVLASLRPYTAGGVTRLAGGDRYATAIAVSQATSAANGRGTVYVATGTGFADGLAGTPPAALVGGPLLTVPGSTLSASIADELRRLNPELVVILGGTSVVSSSMAQQIAAALDR